jgi:hypothetical protein
MVQPTASKTVCGTVCFWDWKAGGLLHRVRSKPTQRHGMLPQQDSLNTLYNTKPAWQLLMQHLISR